MQRLFITMLFCLHAAFCFGQDVPYSRAITAKYYDLEAVDFSIDFFDMQIRNYGNDMKGVLAQSLHYDYSAVWPTGNTQQNGVLGRDYRRICFHIGNVTRQNGAKDTYLVKGKSKTGNNIRDFSGEVKLIRLLHVNDPDVAYVLFGTYIFYEDSAQYGSGVFRGTVECFVHTDRTNTKMMLDESMDGADGYYNRTYVGTWTGYKTKAVKKCIWGDYRLPFTFDFDMGDGEMFVHEKYRGNGWETFGTEMEYIETDGGNWELKNKWWLAK